MINKKKKTLKKTYLIYKYNKWESDPFKESKGCWVIKHSKSEHKNK